MPESLSPEEDLALAVLREARAMLSHFPRGRVRALLTALVVWNEDRPEPRT